MEPKNRRSGKSSLSNRVGAGERLLLQLGALSNVVLLVITIVLAVRFRRETSECAEPEAGGRLAELVAQAVEEKYRRRRDPFPPIRRKIHGHVTFHTRPDRSESYWDPNECQKIQWDLTKVCKEGLHYANGSFTVNRGGVFFIYVQLSFDNLQNGNAPPKPDCFLHKIQKDSKNRSSTLLNYRKPKCDAKWSSAYGFFTANMGALFKLVEGNQISVCTTDYHKLRFSHTHSYFGIMRI